MQPLGLLQTIQIDEFKKLILREFLNLRGENLQVLTWVELLRNVCVALSVFFHSDLLRMLHGENLGNKMHWF